MPSLGSGELIVIFVLVLVLFGPNRLPELARGLGKGMREIRKITGEFQSQLSLLADEEDARKNPTPALQFPDSPETPPQSPSLDQMKWEPHPDSQDEEAEPNVTESSMAALPHEEIPEQHQDKSNA